MIDHEVIAQACSVANDSFPFSTNIHQHRRGSDPNSITMLAEWWQCNAMRDAVHICTLK